MLKTMMIPTLLCALVVTGWIGAVSMGPDPVPEADSGPLHWEQVIDDTAYLVRIDANEPVTVEKYLPEWPDNDFHAVITVVGDDPVLHGSTGGNPVVAVQEHRVDYPMNIKHPNPEGSFTRDPGSYYVVLDSTGAAGTFTVTSDDATLSVLAVDPAIGTFRTSTDKDWDYHLRLYAHDRQVLHASTKIPLHHDYTLTRIWVRGGPWELDFNPVCTIDTEGFWWIVSDQPIDLEARAYPSALGAGHSYYTLDLPLPVPEVGCWHRDDWHGVPGPT